MLGRRSLLAVGFAAFASQVISARRATATPIAAPDDFDFELGAWNGHFRLLKHPAGGPPAWVDYDGTYVVHKTWGGRAIIGELAFGDATFRVDGMTLRLYDAASKRWNISFASSDDGSLGTASIGRFANGRGTFVDRELIRGRPVSVRHVFDAITPASFRYVQSFSTDDGRTWKANWIAQFTRP